MFKIFELFLSLKVLKVIAYVAIVGSLTLTLFVLFDGLATSVAVAIPAGVSEFSATLLPGNLNQCISILISARVAKWVYDRNVKIADKVSE